VDALRQHGRKVIEQRADGRKFESGLLNVRKANPDMIFNPAEITGVTPSRSSRRWNMGSNTWTWLPASWAAKPSLPHTVGAKLSLRGVEGLEVYFCVFRFCPVSVNAAKTS
jgi:hypothetical protein